MDDFDEGHIELRMLMDEPVGQNAIGEYSKKIYSQESFFAWVEIQEYRHIPTVDYRRSIAMHIFEKYVKKDAVCQVGSISEADINKWTVLVKEMRQVSLRGAGERPASDLRTTCERPACDLPPPPDPFVSL